MSELDRIRWHCRRGLLELDLVPGPEVDDALVHRLERALSFQDMRRLAASSTRSWGAPGPTSA